ncbi:MAG TPA: hypothetical protein DCQ31_04665 [Bacteroidales bacterium]|nr:hypothetical protein [Bacteroidales bacterium]
MKNLDDNIEIRPVTTKKELAAFIYLPEKIHKNHKNWLYPIYTDEFLFFNPKKNKAFNYSDTVLALAYKNNVPVGRIMGIINHRYNELHNENHGRFCFLECYNDQPVFDALLLYVENWVKEKGMNKLVGPLGFSDDNPQGFLVDGFDEPTVMITNHSYRYMVDLLHKHPFYKRLDLVQYRVRIPEQIPEVYNKIAERTLLRGYKLIEFTSRKQIKPYIHRVFELMNACYTHIFGYVPFTTEEMDDFAARYLPILNPKFIKVVLNSNNELVAYAIGMPNASVGINKAKGKLFPIGFIKILWGMRKAKQLDMLLGAVRHDQRGLGLDSLMAHALLTSANKAGMTLIDSHHVMETNTPMRSVYEKINGEIYKRYRIFEKDLA